MAAQEPARRDPQGGGRSAGRACRLRRRRARRARTSSSSRTRRFSASPARPYPPARAGGPRELPHRLARRATRRGASTPRPSAGSVRRSSILRSEGIDVHGQIAHPGPVHGGDGARPGRANGRDHRVDLPGRAFRLASARPRRPTPRADGVPVEHVVVDEPVREASMTVHAEPCTAISRRSPRAAARESELAGRLRGPRDAPLHRIGDRCSSARSSRPTSSCASSTPARRTPGRPSPYQFPVFVAGVNTAILVTSSFTMHWALQCDQARRAQGLPRRAWCSRSSWASRSCSRRSSST